MDVPDLAGVSNTAVSQNFAPGAPVSKEMRARVETAARKLGYRPNRLASGLEDGPVWSDWSSTTLPIWACWC